uniref:phosphoribosylaminoimidazole carboxylase n=1 Tax=Corethron hystrix TaxID=216773 RepID=A0A7S1B8T7_9STRA|mmetsp:Transcript_15947/g.35907  ORF Transcript_15947/g.35907 Transcript_15947/m.35907 type:complete len:360 (+) Transcript_15947:34-1113(+)
MSGTIPSTVNVLRRLSMSASQHFHVASNTAPKFILTATVLRSRRSVGRLNNSLSSHCRPHSTSSSDGDQRRETISSLLTRVANGSISPDKAARQIETDKDRLFTRENSPQKTSDLSSFANLDHDRQSRTGFPEAVFGQTKTPVQIAAILDDMARVASGRRRGGERLPILATRVAPEEFEHIRKIGIEHGSMTYHETARIISVTSNNDEEISDHSGDDTAAMRPAVVIATAGTTDLPVAEEAAVTLESAGDVRVQRIYDVGVAGLHRILGALPDLRGEDVRCVIVCAGMDGALPSVVGGLVDVPVIAVPTSVGYGLSLGGISAALTMMNSCAPGVGVVNVDNGFGGAALAYKIVHCGRGR